MSIVELIQDKGTGKLSAVRFVLLLWCTGVFFVWAYTSIVTGALSAVPESVVTILGLVITGKTVQRFGEYRKSTHGRNP